MVKKIFVFLLFLACINNTYGQQLSPQAQIYLWTYEPIEDLYGSYGHNAVHVSDPVNGINFIYNYGTFNFEEPNFISKFVRGRLNYQLSVIRPRNQSQYLRFVNLLKQNKKTIIATPLLLDSLDKQSYFERLEENALPENAYYLYDFFFDNCATRIRDVLQTAVGEELVFDDSYIEKPLSFRELHKQYMYGKCWTNFGIDFILGAKSDRKSTPSERVYIPNELKKAFEHGTILKNGKKEPLTGKDRVVVQSAPLTPEENFFLSPLFVFWILFALIGGYTFLTFKDKSKNNRWIDHIWFTVIGLAGLLVFVMWVGTDHKVTVNNWNLLWVHPLHLVAAIALFFKSARNGWLKGYFKIIFVLTALTLAAWMIIPQYFNPAFMPMMLIIMIRSYYQFTRE